MERPSCRSLPLLWVLVGTHELREHGAALTCSLKSIFEPECVRFNSLDPHFNVAFIIRDILANSLELSSANDIVVNAILHLVVSVAEFLHWTVSVTVDIAGKSSCERHKVIEKLCRLEAVDCEGAHRFVGALLV